MNGATMTDAVLNGAGLDGADPHGANIMLTWPVPT